VSPEGREVRAKPDSGGEPIQAGNADGSIPPMKAGCATLRKASKPDSRLGQPVQGRAAAVKSPYLKNMAEYADLLSAGQKEVNLQRNPEYYMDNLKILPTAQAAYPKEVEEGKYPECHTCNTCYNERFGARRAVAGAEFLSHSTKTAMNDVEPAWCAITTARFWYYYLLIPIPG